ncbi:MAG: hypothetical protein R3F07_00655 [Opitutaceae bacterium]
MMDWLGVIAAAGWYPGVFLSGYALATRLGLSRPNDRGVLAPAIGLTLWTVPMLVAGAFGFFHPWVFGLFGWMVAALAGSRINWRDDLAKLEMSGMGWLVVLLAAAYGVLSLVYTGETFLGGRDQGGYANHALHIARTGSVWIPFPFESFGEVRYHPVYYLQNLSNLSFMRHRMEAQFPPIYAIWMAQSVGVFGRAGALGFNPILAALTVPVVYRMGRQFLGRPAALVGLVVFLLNPAQLWMARITLSEISAQHFVAAAMLCLTGGWLIRRLPVVAMGGILLGAVFWIRIDGLVFVPTLVVALAAVLIWGQCAPAALPSDIRLMLLAGCAALSIAIGGAGAYVVFTEQYFDSIAPLLLRIIVLTLILLPLAALFVFGRIREFVTGIMGNRWVALGLTGLILALIAWAYLVRPMTPPFDMISPLKGRSFREDTLVNLVAYLSEPAALLVLLGLVAAIWQLLRNRLNPAWILPLVIWIGFSTLYLYDPSIYPDHPWAIRRFVPVTLLGCALLAGLGFEVLTRRLRNRTGRLYVAFGTCLLLALVMAPRSSAFFFFKENRGSDSFLQDLAARIEPDALVFADTITLFFDPLYPGLGLRVVRVDLGDPKMPALIRTIIEENVVPGGTVYYLTQTNRDYLIPYENKERLHLEFDFIAPTTAPPPTEIAHADYFLTLYQSKSAPRDPALGYGNVRVGYTAVPGVEEAGFHGDESNEWGPFRWTDGAARLRIPLEEGYWPKSLVFDIRDVPPLGDEVVFRVNGTEIYRQSLATAPGRLEVDLPASLRDRTLDLEILSGTIVPAEIPGRGGDERRLGIRLHGITLSDQPASKGTFEIGVSSRADEVEGGFHDLEVNEKGPFRWTDGAAWVEMPLPAGYVVRRIDLDIQDLPPDGTRIELQLNGETVFGEGFVTPPGRISVPIIDFPPARAGDSLRLDLKSDSFRPIDLGMGADERVLGLRVHQWTVTDRAAGPVP